MAIGSPNQSVKLSNKSLFNRFGNEVVITFDTCDDCGQRFIGTEHDDPGQNPIELAISLCGRFPEESHIN